MKIFTKICFSIAAVAAGLGIVAIIIGIAIPPAIRITDTPIIMYIATEAKMLFLEKIWQRQELESLLHSVCENIQNQIFL